MTSKHVLPPENFAYMDDGLRRVDFILLYNEESEARLKSGHSQNTKTRLKSSKHRKNKVHHKDDQKQHAHGSADEEAAKREFFQENLQGEGLCLEYDRRKDGDDELTVFVKVHTPWSVLCRWAEKLKIKMPLRLADKFDVDKRMFEEEMQQKQAPDTAWRKWKCWGSKESQEQGFTRTLVTMPFQRKRMDKFAILDQETFFSPTQRMEIAWEIMQRARNDPEDDKTRGVDTLLEEGVYEAAFPLHDSEQQPPKNVPEQQWGNRQRLRHTWASWRSIFKQQPLELIRSYFGEKVSFYFAFLGFYTQWLAFPAVAGIAVLLYGVLYKADDEIVADLCSEDRDGHKLQCPICRYPDCNFTPIAENCFIVQWDYRMDNEATLAMAAVTIVWATCFLKAWKRREAELAYEWDTYDMVQEEGVIRPQYEERAPARHHNFVTREIEPYVPRKMRILWKTLSTCVTLFMLTLVAVALVCLVIARIALYGALNRAHVHLYVEVSRILIHLCIFAVVLIFDNIYESIAEKLTTLECPRTQVEWLSSFLWKVFIFELLNDFVPIAYAAWVKGRLVRTPLELNLYTEMCEVGGCMSEVTELIAVLLLARLIVGNTVEIGWPMFKHAVAKTLHNNREENERRDSVIENRRWREDEHLNELELDGVANEYMEMMVQFAFCTLFVPAFPIAPLVCFLNNLLEIRVDAINFIISHRRPLPVRTPGIDIFNDFLDIIAKLAIVSNAALIAFTSDVVPRLYYKHAKRGGETYFGYQTYSLSTIPVHDWPDRAKLFLEEENATACVYSDYREPDDPFDRTQHWWEMMCVRCMCFAFIIVVAYTFQFLYNFAVPTTPTSVNLKIQRRKYVLAKGMEQVASLEHKVHNAVVESKKGFANDSLQKHANGWDSMVVKELV